MVRSLVNWAVRKQWGSRHSCRVRRSPGRGVVGLEGVGEGGSEERKGRRTGDKTERGEGGKGKVGGKWGGKGGEGRKKTRKGWRKGGEGRRKHGRDGEREEGGLRE